MTQIPLLQTKRLTLRPMTRVDWPDYVACMQTKRVRYMGGPFDIAAAWGMFCADHAQWDLFGVGALMIEDLQTEQTLGQVGINAGPLFPEHELGWLVYAASEGKGIAFEAATALRNWARVEKRLHTLVSYVDPENMRSRSLAERLGAFQDETAEKQDENDIVFRHF